MWLHLFCTRGIKMPCFQVQLRIGEIIFFQAFRIIIIMIGSFLRISWIVWWYLLLLLHIIHLRVNRLLLMNYRRWIASHGHRLLVASPAAPLHNGVSSLRVEVWVHRLLSLLGLVIRCVKLWWFFYLRGTNMIRRDWFCRNIKLRWVRIMYCPNSHLLRRLLG